MDESEPKRKTPPEELQGLKQLRASFEAAMARLEKTAKAIEKWGPEHDSGVKERATGNLSSSMELLRQAIQKADDDMKSIVNEATEYLDEDKK